MQPKLLRVHCSKPHELGVSIREMGDERLQRGASEMGRAAHRPSVKRGMQAARTQSTCALMMRCSIHPPLSLMSPCGTRGGP